MEPQYLVRVAFLLLLLRHAVAVRKTRLTWVNGIGHNLGHMHRDAPLIAKLFGGEAVLFCHNPTSMTSEDDMIGYFGDLTQAGSQKLGRITEEVNTLVAHLKNAVAEVGKNGRVIHIAHSQGALVTALAAKHLTPLEMNQMEVLAFGGAAALRKTPQTPFARCINYYSVNDPLLFVVPTAAQALRSGFVHDEEFCFLAPRSGDPIADHGLLGPTYSKALYWEGQRYQAQYQSIVYRTCRFLALLILHLARALLEKAAMLRQEALVNCASMLIVIWKWFSKHWTDTALARRQDNQVPTSPYLVL